MKTTIKRKPYSLYFICSFEIVLAILFLFIGIASLTDILIIQSNDQLVRLLSSKLAIGFLPPGILLLFAAYYNYKKKYSALSLYISLVILWIFIFVVRQ